MARSGRAAASAASAATVAPASAAQAPMVWHEQFAPGSFNLPAFVRRYRGALDIDALSRAFSEVVRRHPPLRTTFRIDGDEALQIVHAPAALTLEVTDLSGLEPAAQDQVVATLVAEATSRPFDLEAGPLFEPQVVRLGPTDHAVIVRVHHTVFDDASVGVFRRELAALYEAAVIGSRPPLPDLPVAGPAGVQADLAGQRAWWADHLAGAPICTQLDLGADGGAVPLRVELPPALAASLRDTARRLRTTPYVVALAAFGVVVGRWTGLDDLVVATVVANRNRPVLEPLIGCFTKKVPLRLRLDGDPAFADLVGRARAALLGALAHPDLSFDDAIDAGLGEPAYRHGVVPHVAVVFQAETPRAADLSLPGLRVEPLDVPAAARRERHFSEKQGSRWGTGAYLPTFLILSLDGSPDGIGLIARGVFNRDSCRRLLDEYIASLGELTADPQRSCPSPRPAGPGEQVTWRGFGINRPPVEAALARCPGVAAVAVEVDGKCTAGPQLVAHVAGDGSPPPTLAALRHALWSQLPGVPWPAAATGAVSPGEEPSPTAAAIARRWTGSCGRRYWQDFSFLPVLAALRAAGWTITDEQVVRHRTVATLAADLDTVRRG